MSIEHLEARQAYAAAYRLARIAGVYRDNMTYVLERGQHLYVKIFGNRNMYYQQTAQRSYDNRNLQLSGWVNQERWVEWSSLDGQGAALRRLDRLFAPEPCGHLAARWDEDLCVWYCWRCGMEWEGSERWPF